MTIQIDRQAQKVVKFDGPDRDVMGGEGSAFLPDPIRSSLKVDHWQNGLRRITILPPHRTSLIRYDLGVGKAADVDFLTCEHSNERQQGISGRSKRQRKFGTKKSRGGGHRTIWVYQSHRCATLVW